MLCEESGLRWVAGPLSESGARRGFCGECGSSLFWDAPARDTVSIAAGTLDEPTGLRLLGHVYVAQVGDYYELPADGLPRHERLTGSPASLDSQRSILAPVSAPDQVEIRRLDATEVVDHLDGLADVLADCVAGGASVGYMAPFPHEDARAAFGSMATEVEQGRRLLLAAFAAGRVVGTVQVILGLPPNQPHRGEITKLLVHRSARRRGIAELLMARAESEARAEGKTLLVLDAVTGGDAERLYARLGWTKVGVIPGYALFPDGRPCDTTYFWKTVD